jgi:hypothetical protein
MPQIRQYQNTQQIDDQPLGQAAYRIERGAYHIGNIVRQAGDEAASATNEIEQHQAQGETSDLSKKVADTDLAIGQAYEKAKQTSDVSDPNFASSFMQTMQPALDKLGDGLQTKQGMAMAREASSRIQTEYGHKALADSAMEAGDKAHANFDSATSSLAASASLDPTSTPEKLAMVDTIAPQINGAEHQAEYIRAAKERIALAGGNAVIDQAMQKGTTKASAAARAMVLDPNGAYVKNGPAGAADAWQSKLNEWDRQLPHVQRAAIAEQNAADKEDFRKAQTAITLSLFDDKGNVHVAPNYYAAVLSAGNMPGADAGGIKEMMGAGRTFQDASDHNTPISTDPHTYEDFRNRAFLGANDPNALSSKEVYQAAADGKLNPTDFRFFTGAANAQDRENPEAKDFNKFLTSMKPYIDKSSMLKVDAYGAQKWYEFSNDAQKAYEDARQNGKSVQDAQGIVRNMVGNSQYHATKDQLTGAMVTEATGTLKPLARAGAAPTPRMQGEDPAAYLKRIGAQ